MKTPLTAILLAIATLISSTALAGKSISDTERGEFYVTSTTKECQWLADNRAKRRFYFGLYLNRQPTKYDPRDDQRVYIWLDSCEEIGKYLALEGKRIYVELQPSNYSPGHWDPDVAYLSTTTDCSRCSPNVVFANRDKIEFLYNEERGGELIATITSSFYLNYAQFDLPARSDSGTNVRFYIDSAKLELHYFNSKGQQVFTQPISRDEAETIRVMARTASKSCPIDVTISRNLRKVIQFKSTCQPFAQINVNNSAG